MKQPIPFLLVAALFALSLGTGVARQPTAEQCEWKRASAATAVEGLVGSWKLSSQACAWTGVRPIDRDLRVTLNKDRAVSLSEGSKVVAKGTWTINSQGRLGIASLTAAEAGGTLDGTLTQYFAGFISFCEAKKVRFNSSYSDGCDTTFDRIDTPAK